MKRGYGARGIHLENRAFAARAAPKRGAIEVSVAPLNQSGVGIRPISPLKGMERREDARGIHLENRASVSGAAGIGCSVEISVARLDQPGDGIRWYWNEFIKHLILLVLGRVRRHRCLVACRDRASWRCRR